MEFEALELGGTIDSETIFTDAPGEDDLHNADTLFSLSAEPVRRGWTSLLGAATSLILSSHTIPCEHPRSGV